MTFTAGGSQGRPPFFNHLIPSIIKARRIRPNKVREREPLHP